VIQAFGHGKCGGRGGRRSPPAGRPRLGAAHLPEVRQLQPPERRGGRGERDEGRKLDERSAFLQSPTPAARFWSAPPLTTTGSSGATSRPGRPCTCSATTAA
jgi:hypothetical protein